MKNLSETTLIVCCVLYAIACVAFCETDVPDDGRQVTTFTRVIAPAGLAVSPTGEVFVSSDPNGAIKTVESIGKIIRYIDTDNDGVADNKTTFVGEFNSPRGMCYVDGTLYAVHPPFLSAFSDEDGDGIADKKTTLVKRLGFDYRYRGADHSSNDVRMGIDGWLYLAIGDYGLPGATGTDGKQVFHRGGCVARVRPDGTEFEIFADGTRNIYDVAVDPYLNAFTRDNTNDGGRWDVRLNHITAMARYGYPSLYKHFNDEIMQPLADFLGGSGTGALYLHEPGFPSYLSDTLLTADYAANQGAIFYHPLTSIGASFKLKGFNRTPGNPYPKYRTKDGELLLKLVQVTDMDVDGHSRLFACGYRGGVVMRLSYPGLKAAEFPDLRKASDTALLGHLIARSQVLRLNAQRQLLKRGAKPVFADGLRKIAYGDHPLYSRIAAVFTLKQLEGENSHKTLVKLAAKGELREFSLRALADRKTQLTGVPTSLFVAALKDRNPRVQLQAVIGLARLNRTESAAAMVPLLANRDPVLAHTTVQSLVALRTAKPCLTVMATGTSSPTVEGAVRVLKQLHDEKVVDTLIGLYAKHKNVAYRQRVLEVLFRLHYREAPWQWQDTTKGQWWWLIRPDTRGPYYARETWSQSKNIGKFLENAFLREDDTTMLATFIEQFQLNRLYIESTLTKLLKIGEENEDLRLSTAGFVAANEVYNPLAVRFVAKVAQSIDLAENSIFQEGLARYLAADNEEGFEAAMDLICENAERKKPGYRLRNFFWGGITRGNPPHDKYVSYFIQQTSAKSRAIRILAYTALLRTPEHKMMDEEAKQKAAKFIETAFLDETQIEVLLGTLALAGRRRYVIKRYVGFIEKHLDSENEDVRLMAEKAIKTRYGDQMRKRQFKNRVTIASLQAKLSYAQLIAIISKAKGDPKKGQLLFSRCAACHTTTSTETPKGPSLAGLSNRFDQKYILESILKPSEKIAQGYVTTLFKMNDESSVLGFISAAGSEVIEIRDIKGIATKIKVKDINERRSQEASMMPDGIVGDLTVEEFASLIAYLKKLE